MQSTNVNRRIKKAPRCREAARQVINRSQSSKQRGDSKPKFRRMCLMHYEFLRIGRQLTPNDVATYDYLCALAGPGDVAEATTREIAEFYQIGRNTVARALNHLSLLGWIKPFKRLRQRDPGKYRLMEADQIRYLRRL
jgi:predicted transcriptional regulator